MTNTIDDLDDIVETLVDDRTTQRRRKPLIKWWRSQWKITRKATLR